MTSKNICISGVIAVSVFFTACGNAVNEPRDREVPVPPSEVATEQMDELLKGAVGRQDVLGVVAMAVDKNGVLYRGAFGTADDVHDMPIRTDAIFRIASMTKPVTSVAVMQLVERGDVLLDGLAAEYLPELSKLKVVEEFDTENGTYLLRPPETAITVQQLLTHTSGFGYAFTSSTLRDYQPEAEDVDVVGPLLFDPGTAWQYGTSTDWLGRLVERVSGQDLDTYFREHIFAPLQMLNTGFNVPESSWARIATLAHRQPTGTLFQDVREDLSVVATYSGGGGLLSTADDYARFMRMWLNGGMLDGRRVLSAETIALMAENHIGDLAAGGWVSAQPDRSNDFKPTAEGRGRWGLGFLVNLDDEPDRRMAGSLAWAGLYNTYFWIDPSSDVAGVLLTQVLPFGDPQVLSVFEEFERATYSLAEVVR